MKFFIFIIAIIIITNEVIFTVDDKIFIKDIRHIFFIIYNTENYELDNNNILYVGEYNKIGRYKILDNRNGMALCRMEAGDSIQLNEKCYIKGIFNKNLKKNLLLKERKDILHIKKIKYQKFGKMYITEKPISLKQLKNIDNLKNYLIGIENEIQNKYNANILIDRIIKKNRQYFISKLRKKKVLCIVNGKLGYTNIVNNEIIFKNISKQTLNKFIDKFYIHVILE